MFGSWQSPLHSNHLEKCNLLPETYKKGKVHTRKYLTLLTRPIGLFMTDFYIPLLKKYALHSAYVRILSNNGCGRMRYEWFKNEDAPIVKTIRDYAERLKFEFNNEIQSKHFGASRNLSIEGCSVWHLYPSDAADEPPCVDLGGRRLIKKQQSFPSYSLSSVPYPPPAAPPSPT